MRARVVTLGLLLALALALAGAGGGPARADGDDDTEIAVIVQPQSPATHLSTAELAEIFTAARRNWSDGKGIVPFNLPPNGALRTVFDKVVLGLSPDEVGRFWVDQRIRGGSSPPRQVDDPRLMLRIVARIPGAIGYVPSAMVDTTVRVVARIRHGEVVRP